MAATWALTDGPLYESKAWIPAIAGEAIAKLVINCDARNMREVIVDCSGIQSTEEFWQRYLDTARPEGAAMFGRNLDAFWDAIEGGGPGWPGEVSLVFLHSAHLSGLRNRGGNAPFLDALKFIADKATAISVKFVD